LKEPPDRRHAFEYSAGAPPGIYQFFTMAVCC
jgi:hypothetical protein